MQCDSIVQNNRFVHTNDLFYSMQVDEGLSWWRFQLKAKIKMCTPARASSVRVWMEREVTFSAIESHSRRLIAPIVTQSELMWLTFAGLGQSNEPINVKWKRRRPFVLPPPPLLRDRVQTFIFVAGIATQWHGKSRWHIRVRVILHTVMRHCQQPVTTHSHRQCKHAALRHCKANPIVYQSINQSYEIEFHVTLLSDAVRRLQRCRDI